MARIMTIGMTKEEQEAWEKFAGARALQLWPNGHVNSPQECAEFADRMIIELRKRRYAKLQ